MQRIPNHDVIITPSFQAVPGFSAGVLRFAYVTVQIVSGVSDVIIQINMPGAYY